MTTYKTTSGTSYTIANGGYQSGYGAIPPAGSVTISTTPTTGSYMIGGGGGAGQIYTTTTTGTGNWQNTNPYNTSVMTVRENPSALEVKGKLVVNGQDLEERLRNIEKVLQIPERDVILEKKYPKLKKLYDEYIATLGKYRTFESIKGNDE